MSKSLPLYTHINGEYIKIDTSLNVGSLNLNKQVKFEHASEKYISIFTSRKNVKEQKNEKNYFADFQYITSAVYVSDITTDSIELYRNALLKKGLKPSTIERRSSSIRHFLNQCVEWKYIQQNPFSKVKKLKVEKNHFKPWPDDVIISVYDSLSEPFKSLFMFLCLTGARPSEVKNLKWSDVDYENMIIKIRCGKNAKISRTLVIFDELDRFLHTLEMTDNLVFHKDGKTVSNDNYYQAIKHRLNKLGRKDLVPYGLRHTFANWLSNSGVNAFKIKDLMGHADIKTTLNYVHSEKKDLIQVIETAKPRVLIKPIG